MTTEPAKLRYRVVRAPSAVDIDALEEVISNPLAPEVTLVTDWSENLTNLSVASLASGSTYYFTIAVRDVNDNYAIYPPIAMQTASAEIDMPGAASVTMGLTPAEITITWPAATSNNNVNPAFQYKLVKAAAKTSIDSIAEIEAIVGDDVLTNWTAGELSKNISGLVYDVPYYFGILVRDSGSNIAIYSPITYTPITPIITPTATPTSVAQSPTPTVAATPTDTTAPTVTLASISASPTGTSPIAFSATFAENVSGFDSSDITVINGIPNVVGGSGASYSFTVTPSGQGTVSVSIPANKAIDTAGNYNMASNTINIEYDSLRPSPAILTIASDPFGDASIAITAVFSKGVSGFIATDVSVTNANITSFGGSGTTYIITVAPIASGMIIVTIPEGGAIDSAGNLNTASNTITRIYDGTAPGAPTSLVVNPTGPANNNSPVITGTAEASSTIKLYTTNDCTGTVAATGTASALASPGITLTIADNTTTTFKATATDSVGNVSSCSLIGATYIEDTLAPTVGTGITFASVTGTTLTANWGAASDTVTAAANLQYKVVKSTLSTDIDTPDKAAVWADLLMDWSANTLTKNVLGLSSQTTYYFAVVVKDAAGNKTLYGPTAQTTSDITAPVAGTGITFASVTGTTLTANWGAASDTVTAAASLQYKLVKSTLSTDIDTPDKAAVWADLLMDWSANTVTKNVLGLSSQTTYYFAVVVKDTAGNKTLYGPTAQATPDITAPVAGTGITFASVTGTTLTANWGAASDTVTTAANLQYKLVKSTLSTNIDTADKAAVWADLLMDWSANTLTSNVTSLSSQTAYYFALVVKDAAGNKTLYGPTAQTTSDITAPVAGTGITFASITSTSMTVNWGLANDTVTAAASLQYKLVRASSAAAINSPANVETVPGGDVLMTWTSGNPSFKNLTGLSFGTTYYFALVVQDAAGNKTLYGPTSQVMPGISNYSNAVANGNKTTAIFEAGKTSFTVTGTAVVDILCVGGGGNASSAGGGGGGVVRSRSSITLVAATYTISVGAAGVATTLSAGADSLTCDAGGTGGAESSGTNGGGAGCTSTASSSWPGSSNALTYSGGACAIGNSGDGRGVNGGGGAGSGGNGSPGTNSPAFNGIGGNGGSGATSSITGSSLTYGGGGLAYGWVLNGSRGSNTSSYGRGRDTGYVVDTAQPGVLIISY